MKAKIESRGMRLAWEGCKFQSSSGLTEEFSDFAKDFKKWISDNLPEGVNLVNFNRGHFYCFGFVQKGEKFVYFRISDVRFFPDQWANNILIRTAKGEKDYTGGINKSATLESFKESVKMLLK